MVIVNILGENMTSDGCLIQWLWSGMQANQGVEVGSYKLINGVEVMMQASQLVWTWGK